MSKYTAIYVRVSSKQQTTRSQLPDLKSWASAQSEPVKWYTDKTTGTKMERPAMQQLLADVAAGKVARIVVWRLDRLGRTAAGLTKLFADLQERKVALVSLKDSFDLSSAAGRLMAHVLASVAAYETEVRRERQTAGIEAAKAQGKQWGGREAGSRNTKTAKKVAAVKSLHKAGQSISSIARATGVSRPTIYSIIG